MLFTIWQLCSIHSGILFALSSNSAHQTLFIKFFSFLLFAIQGGKGTPGPKGDDGDAGEPGPDVSFCLGLGSHFPVPLI